MRHFIREHHLISDRQKLLVAVSGGPDSICLLHILVEMQKELGIGLHIAHLNHQLRGAESEADAQYVAGLAQQLHLPATIEARDVKGYQARQRVSPEEAAREVRYGFLAQAAGAIGADRVAAGHTADDHIETILMHLIRGTGIRGLRGLQPVSRWPSPDNNLTIVRPLLAVNREETVNYCQHHQLKPRTDTSNRSLSPLRNRIRQQLLPLLRSYNPRVAEALIRTARIAGDDIDLLDGESNRLWHEIAQKQGNTIILDKEKFLESPPARQRHLLRMSIEKLSGNLKDIEAHHTAEIIAALNKPAGKMLNLPSGLVFSIDYHRYVLGPDPAALAPLPVLPGEIELKLPGTTQIPGWRIEAAIIGREAMKNDADDSSAHLDLDKTGDKLTVRRRKTGDRFQPLGMSQPKKLGEFMIDSKIPGAWRERIPIVCSPQHIVWVAGLRIDDRVKVTEDTNQVLCLEIKRN
ncbi:tRNA lysidine(34) synthetase TilS [Chloroflexota bacterium]